MLRHALAVLTITSTALAQPTIRPLLVSGDPLPDGTTFFSHYNRAVIDGNYIAAQITNENFEPAIIRINIATGQIDIIATLGTPSPTYPEFPLHVFTPPALAGDTVVFSAGSTRTGTSSSRREGVYKSDGGPLQVVADELAFPSLLPRRVSTDGTSVLFKRAGAGNPIAITPINGGPVEPFAFQGTPAPDGGILFDIWEGFARGGGGGLSALISGISPTYWAVYRFTPPSNDLTTVARTGDPMPGQPGRSFNALITHDAEADAVLFTANDGGFPLNFDVLCINDAAGTRVIAHDDTPMPAVPGRTFDAFSGSTDGRDTLFFGTSQPDGPTPIYGAYWHRDGQNYPVIDSLDTIDGLPVRDIAFADQSIDGDRAVVALVLGNFQKFGLYLVEFPSRCPPDLDASGTLNFFDVATFLAAFNAQEPAADFAEPTGSFDFFDVAAFLAAYNAGCP